MKKVYMIALILLVAILTGCTSSKATPENVAMPDNFGFILKYGYGPKKNELNTMEGTFTKDLVIIDPVTTDLRLTTDEMKNIYEEMVKLDILSYPDEFFPESNMKVTPYRTYEFDVRFGNSTKKILWKDESLSESRKAVQLRSLFKKIINTIENKEEFKRLPEAQGGYA
ncbi:hypothetical protein H1S01_18335 [Heliobacterium chlorum]|uniref:Lipoprotein n=1 Tax=Heliobacterium chlorum TaxID=2698 RepID=A0ABR7T870_HELCL|nr:hypothetical protein [Heliobacterium chlorum]MBC9786417.1 hypothetical protein [Heliobacterium chlorum]